ncbi:MAG: cell wall hydrolase [Parvibaculum sp.]|uniref:cell wall hydrolase n=1 Tax=Parvibaculum sp. TaxID=2024848 RepID=UPI00391AEA7C
MNDRTGDILLVAGIFTAIFGWLKLRALPKGKVTIPSVTVTLPDGTKQTAYAPRQPAPVPPPAAPFSPSLVNDFFMPSMTPPQPTQAAAPRVGSFGWASFDEFAAKATELDVFARTLFGEARDQGRLGIEAVAAVIMNRVADRRFPNTAREVCLAYMQFSLWNEGERDLPNSKLALSVTDSNSAFRTCLEVASDALSGRLKDPTGGAHHYYNPKKATPRWASSAKSSKQIGDHIFLVGVP